MIMTLLSSICNNKYSFDNGRCTNVTLVMARVYKKYTYVFYTRENNAHSFAHNFYNANKYPKATNTFKINIIYYTNSTVYVM